LGSAPNIFQYNNVSGSNSELFGYQEIV